MATGGQLADAVRAFSKGDAAGAAACLSPDVVWHSPGRRQPAAGTHRGLDATLAAFGTIAAAPGTLELELVAAMAGDGYESVLYRHRRTREDGALEADIALVARIAGGCVVEVWEHIFGLFAFDEFYGGPTSP